ncbi:MAG: Abi family protein, partial [Cyanobacteria bacterium MAG APA_bin_95]|nr:Abi family protein [Cyanobacteria bacterium MAG APA_bin_95]
LAQAIQGAEQRRLHNTLIILSHLLEIVAPGTPWREQVAQLITDYPLADPLRMGFPTDWRTRSPWGLAD